MHSEVDMNEARQFGSESAKLGYIVRSRRALPGPGYLAVLVWIHRALRVDTYVEIGVQNGDSLLTALPETLSIGIDPEPTPNKPLSDRTRLFKMTSDEFFGKHRLDEVLGQRNFDIAFIDGLHLFEQAFRDFIHLERYAGRDSLIVLHDCYPLDGPSSARRRTTDFYSGDVWKLALCLRRERPDLKMRAIPTAPTGLCLVTGMDSTSDKLERGFDSYVERYIGLDFEDYKTRRHQMPAEIPNTKVAVISYLESALPFRWPGASQGGSNDRNSSEPW